jgi:hypothetical protein
MAAESGENLGAEISFCRRLGMREGAYFVTDLMFRGEWADRGLRESRRRVSGAEARLRPNRLGL